MLTVPCSEQLALTAPDTTPREPEHENMNGAETVRANGPWWAWRVR